MNKKKKIPIGNFIKIVLLLAVITVVLYIIPYFLLLFIAALFILIWKYYKRRSAVKEKPFRPAVAFAIDDVICMLAMALLGGIILSIDYLRNPSVPSSIVAAAQVTDALPVMFTFLCTEGVYILVSRLLEKKELSTAAATRLAIATIPFCILKYTHFVFGVLFWFAPYMLLGFVLYSPVKSILGRRKAEISDKAVILVTEVVVLLCCKILVLCGTMLIDIWELINPLSLNSAVVFIVVDVIYFKIAPKRQ